jgi:protein ECT2
MEPVQRIPRYTLLFRTMLKHMAPGDSQRDKLAEADEIASKIALAEADEQTKRAAIFYCLTATIDGFPPDLFSNSRRFIDCIDVEDILTDASAPSSSASTSGSSTSSLHCTLFLFDDKLVIVKRPGNGEKGARVLSGLDELDKVTKAGGIPAGKKKSGMSCKGVLDVTDVVATDVGGAGKLLKRQDSTMCISQAGFLP